MAYNPLAFGLMLVGTGALVFANYLYQHYRKQIDEHQEKTFGAIFMILGAVTAIFGFNIFFESPIPGQYIEIYGVGYLVFSMLMILAGLVTYHDWDFRPASVFAVVGGIVLIGSAFTVFAFQMSKSPLSTTAMFALAGIGCILSYAFTRIDDANKKRTYLILAIVAFVVVGLLGVYSGLAAQYGHVESALAAAAG